MKVKVLLSMSSRKNGLNGCVMVLCVCRLQQIADRLVECFVSAGLMEREWDRVKIHGTVMNTLFRKDPSGEADPQKV